MTFSTDDVAVIMTGEEWFAILARIKCLLEGKTKLESAFTLSAKGARAYNSGMGKLQKQVVAAADASPERKPERRLDVPCPSDHDAMLAIQELLDGVEWSSDTRDAVALIMIRAGYPIRDLNECELADDADEQRSHLHDAERIPPRGEPS